MACDLCSKTGTYLTDLKVEYQTEDIKQVCSDCGTLINDHLWNLRKLSNKVNQSFLKRFMTEKKQNLATKN